MSDKCKKCGACTECGASPQIVPMPYPVYPYYADWTWRPQPWQPYKTTFGNSAQPLPSRTFTLTTSTANGVYA